MSALVLYLALRIGGDQYVIDTAHVVEVIPLVRLKALPGAPHGTAGMLNYHGAPVPVVDLNQIATGSPTSRRLMTRIVVVRYAEDDGEGHNGDGELLGLLVPEATDVLRVDPERFEPLGIASERAPYLGPVLPTADGALLQRVTIAALLTHELRTALGRAAEAA